MISSGARPEIELLTKIQKGEWYERLPGIVVISSAVAVVAGTIADIASAALVHYLGWS